MPGWEPLLATVWEYVDPIEPFDWVAFGGAVRSLHGFSDLAVHEHPPTPERLARAVDLDVAPALDPAVADRLRAMVPVFEILLENARWWDLPLMPSHGDLWTKNVIPRGDGRVVLCDPDFLGLRPTACDLGMVRHETGGDDRWARFVEGYGALDVPCLDQLETGRRASILNWTIYVLERRRGWIDYIDELSRGEW